MSVDDALMTESATAERRPSRAMAALCGVLAGALGLGIAELIAGLVPGAPSPVLSIGALLISLQPPNAKQLVVDLFGTNDKAVLSLAVVIGALLFGRVAYVLDDIQQRTRRIEQLLRDGHL